MRLALLGAHNIEEYDALKLFHGLGYDVFGIGGYSNPAEPVESLRPALPDLPYHFDLDVACAAKRMEHEKDAPYIQGRPVIDWAKADLPDAVMDWADVIIVSAFEHTWIAPQWERLKASGKRIVWRTIGQSGPDNERFMRPFHDDGLEIVRYSPNEKAIPNYAGEDALIRFYKDPNEWTGWEGHIGVVLNVTQNLYQRHPFTNWEYWDVATADLPRLPVGEGSDIIGGPGKVPFETMKKLLRTSRCYLYTGTQPASYTLGFIEAMMTGIPLISISKDWMQLPDAFEADDLALAAYSSPEAATTHLRLLLNDTDAARLHSQMQRQRAIDLFGIESVGMLWRAFLG